MTAIDQLKLGYELRIKILFRFYCPIIYRKDQTKSGECCGNGQWTLDCQDANFSINYENCTVLESCTGEQTFDFEVEESSGENTRGSVVISEFMAANKKVKQTLSTGYQFSRSH